MKDSINKHKSAAAAIFLAFLLVFAYKMFFASPAAPETAVASAPIGADLLKISSDLSRVTLSQEIFKHRDYLSLTDFTSPIPQQPVGRKNPFDVIGRE